MEHIDIDTEDPPFSIGIRMPSAMGYQIQEIARRERNAVAAVCRRLLAAGLERELRRTSEPRR